MSEFKNVLNDASELVGYSYQVTEGNVTSTTFFDTNFEIKEKCYC